MMPLLSDRRPATTRVDAECPSCGAYAVPCAVMSEPATFRRGVAETPDNSDAEIVAACTECGAEDFTRDEKALILDHAWELLRGLAD